MFRTPIIGLAATALLWLGAAALTPTTASAHDYEWEHYCYHHPYDPRCYHEEDGDDQAYHHHHHHDEDEDEHEHEHEHKHHDHEHDHDNQDHEHDHDDHDQGH